MANDLACQWFGLRAEFEAQDRAAKRRGLAREVLLSVVTLGLSLTSYNPRRFCDVIVYRLDSGKIVMIFRYDEVEGATAHIESLRTRLESMAVQEFCEDIGVPTTEISGGGDQSMSATVDWVEIPDYRRRTSD